MNNAYEFFVCATAYRNDDADIQPAKCFGGFISRAVRLFYFLRPVDMRILAVLCAVHYPFVALRSGIVAFYNLV